MDFDFKTAAPQKQSLIEQLEVNGFCYSYDDHASGAEVYSKKKSEYLRINSIHLLCNKVFLLENIAIFKNKDVEVAMMTYKGIRWW